MLSKYAWYALTTFKNTRVYKMDVLFRIIGSILMVIALREIWLVIYREGTHLDQATGVSAQSMAAYAMVSVILGRLLSFGTVWDVSDRVRTGDIVFDLQKPWSFQWMHLSKAAGLFLFSLCFVIVPLALTILLFYPIPLPGGWQAAAFVLSVFLAFLLAYAIDFIVGLFAFIFTEIWGFDFIKDTVIQLCSGSFVPLWLFPEFLAQALRWLPFQGIYSIPLSLFIGRTPASQIIPDLLFQAVWALILFAIGYAGMKSAHRMLLTTGG
ncbi:ABC-2 family transporter protein [Paenibacillus sp. J2TS4]|uniref:ABC transporter permease n=1 Tax=Paenibacillus sp. J2TS4 TaxID=2807194 RepID=UPI001B296EEC|nr:ABC-2 family transporter protein [Paenibacillus sp. J2TS4]GIP36005.1 ABC transporter permease [Paenibacillus sp. J2TS4]